MLNFHPYKMYPNTEVFLHMFISFNPHDKEIYELVVMHRSQIILQPLMTEHFSVQNIQWQETLLFLPHLCPAVVFHCQEYAKFPSFVILY